MAITFNSIGHFFASVFQKSETVITKIEGTETTVEAVTAVIPTYGPLALPIEKAAYAVLGEVAAVLSSADAATKAKLVDAGLDQNIIATVEDLLKGGVSLSSLLKAL